MQLCYSTYNSSLHLSSDMLQVATYAQIADALETTARAVGQVRSSSLQTCVRDRCLTQRVQVLRRLPHEVGDSALPDHRVLSSDYTIGGYMSAWVCLQLTSCMLACPALARHYAPDVTCWIVACLHCCTAAHKC